MTRDEIVQNVGTIAKSGSLEFIANLSEEARKNSNIIGQFGVGFYSVFMVADEVRIRTGLTRRMRRRSNGALMDRGNIF